jgi:hypothetical protein
MRRGWMAWLAALGWLLPASAMAQTMPGWSIGPEAYWYTYRETPSLVYQWGPFAGLDAAYTFKIHNFFITIDGGADVGYLDYKSNVPTAGLVNGSGRLNGIWNYKGEFRLLFGADLAVSPFFYISPFAGAGYRILFEQQSGRTTTNGAVAYDRLSQYYYLPLGIGLSIVAGGWVLRPSAEYDVFIGGNQTSYLSQVGFNQDLNSRQEVGYGARASFLMETGTSWGRIAFGPFFRYWNIGQSRGTPGFIGNTPVIFFEPANNTMEGGLTLHFLF